MAAHALLSASSSKRWLLCTPAPRLEATLPEQKRPAGQFDYSAEGTTAHELGEAKLRLAYNQIKQAEFDKIYEKIKSTKYYNETFEHYVDNYVLYVRSQIGDGDRPLFEQRVDFSEWVNDGFGTADVVIISKNKIRVIDLKFGMGIPVSAIDNPQLRLYALGAYSKFREEFPDIKEVEYTIHQPRLDSISTDGTTIDKLLDWAVYYVKPKAKKAWAGLGEFIPSEEGCQFCRAKATCRARSDYVNDLAKLEFRPAPLLNEDEIEKVLTRSSMLVSWANDIKEYALQRAINNGVLPQGYTLTTTKTHRKITDHTLAAHILLEKGYKREDIYEKPGLKSVAQLEKLGAKNEVSAILGDLIQRPDGSPKLVKNDSKGDFE